MILISLFLSISLALSKILYVKLLLRILFWLSSLFACAVRDSLSLQMVNWGLWVVGGLLFLLFVCAGVLAVGDEVDVIGLSGGE